LGGSASNADSLGGFSASAYALLSGANFISASISGSALATQPYVLGRGYQTTSGSVSYAASAGAAPTPASVTYSASSGISASLSNFNQNNYALLSSANFNAASVSGSAIATIPYVNSLGYVTSSGSIANAGYAASAGAAPTPASVTYSASSGVSASLSGFNPNSYALLSGANFTSASISGSTVATQNFVTSQGYLTSASSINSASLGGTAASAYALLASSNFTAASVGGAAVATQPYVNSLGFLTSSGSISTASNSASLGGVAASAYALLASPTLTGAPLAPTVAASVNNTQIATTAFVRNITSTASLVNSGSLNNIAASAYALLASANFTAASVGGAAVATQPYVNSLGFLTSSGSISTASNSASLGGISSSSYVLLNSPSFNGTPLAPTAASTVNNAQIATTAFVKQLLYPQTLAFTVSGSLSTAGPWDYRLYNDTGQNRIITGVRASVGTPSSGSSIIIDVRNSGSTIFTASGFTLQSGSVTTGLVTTGFNSGSTVLTTDYLTVALKQVGSTNSGSNLVVQVMWT